MSGSISVQLKKGVLDLCVLALLEQVDCYAYDIVKNLSGPIDMGEGTIYPLMRRMQNEEYVTSYLCESENGPSRKYYRITDKGRLYLSNQKKEWNVFVAAVGNILGEKS
ncbi:PadR family transcriptional regulator [Microvirga sp. W0021]|uniref:PadR family transcriptional regulator n=1 Tax=Hohaiivirga grylli TaxID=3133970 RepID=A0ABV0BHA6_9HYPH